ncbi:hypothetical protein L1987_02322 [Smallanthus sonchifolius]|uniref:Uncharacterized protein n=1 Tax=Smallanthus sonchifolius TaxID=185202 RepID=A0ACB9K7F4_9ASTR|nr:hypothetical protein L1987_02322 [Smallanthus sonchifolius]
MGHKWPSFTYQPSSWMDDFVGFSSARRNSHRRSTSDPVAFVETPFTSRDSNGNNGFERLDDEQLSSMFSDGFTANLQSMKSSPTASDQNSDNEEPKSTPQMKSEPGEVEDSGGYEHDLVKPGISFSGDGGTIVDPKRVKRILANRQSAQRSRIRKLHYISELERSVTTLQTEVSTLSPRVAFLDHQRLILNVDNSTLKQRIAALAQDKIFKDAHQEALKKEIERLRRVYHEQNMNKVDNTTTTTDVSPAAMASPPPPPAASVTVFIFTQPNHHFKMKKMVAGFACFSAFILCLLVWNVMGRSLQYDDSEHVSDGVSNGADSTKKSFLLPLKGSIGSEEQCEQMYGFLPCSSNLAGHLFLIVVYEYLLYHGESYAGGDGRIFGVLGNNFFGASVFQLLDSLPDSLILLASGLSSSQEKAQDYVVTGAGLLAGSSILLLTLLWGVCFICGRTNFYTKPGSKVKNKGIQLLTGSGVVTDAETSYHAKIMFFSLVPFAVILLPSVFGLSYSSSGHKIFVLVSLCVSVICLFAYFVYQLFDERIQKRRLEYAEVERKVELHVPFYEVQALMLEREKHLMIRLKEMEKMMKFPETNASKTMTREEFFDTFQDWLDVTRQLMDDPYSLDKSGTEYNQVAKLLLEDKNQLIELISLMVDRASGEKLLKEDGTRDESAIDRFFERIDTNHNGFISKSELKNFIMEVNYEEILMDDEIAEIIMRHLDIDGNGNIDKHEFKSGVTKWLKEMDRVASGHQKKKTQDNSRETDRYQRAEAKAKANEKFKAIILLMVGIFMLTVLAEPLVESVREFSESVEIKPFYVSFILVPFATNARTAIAAIRAASQKRHQTTSLTFSEIYHRVFMNNILGFSVLVSVIYFRGFTWHFSAEILVVVIVCVIMGLLASVRSKFPNWTLLIAFPLYPLSLVVVYFVEDSIWST